MLDAQSWGNAGVTLDASSPLNDEGTIRGRVIANGVAGNGWRDDMEHDVGLLYGTIDADLGDRTTASLGLAWAMEDIDGYSWGGLPTQPDGAFFPFYDATTASALPWEYSHRRQTQGFVEIEHELDGGWVIVGKGRASEGATDMLSSYMFWNEDDALVRSGGFFDYDNRSYSADVHATGPFRLFGRQHELVVGVSGNRDYTSYDTPEGYEFVIPDPADLGSPDGPGPMPYPDGGYWSDYQRQQWGLYANSRWSVTDQLSLLAGGRVSWFYDRMVADWGEESYDADARFTPYVGAVYDIDPTWTVYASYTGIFMPQSELQLGGGFVPPVEGTNAEAGVKAGFLDGALQASAALFQTDLAVPDYGAPCPPGQFPPCFNTPGEKVRTQGFEVELTGAVTPRWNILASYTYANAEYVEGPNEGERYDPSYSPAHLGKLTTTYALPGAFEGLTVGAGMRAQSGLYAEGEAWPSLAPFLIAQPGYAVFDAMARYMLSERTAIQLNVENLFDRDYYSAIADPGYGNFKGTGRVATLTLRHLF